MHCTPCPPHTGVFFFFHLFGSLNPKKCCILFQTDGVFFISGGTSSETAASSCRIVTLNSKNSAVVTHESLAGLVHSFVANQNANDQHLPTTLLSRWRTMVFTPSMKTADRTPSGWSSGTSAQQTWSSSDQLSEDDGGVQPKRDGGGGDDGGVSNTTGVDDSCVCSIRGGGVGGRDPQGIKSDGFARQANIFKRCSDSVSFDDLVNFLKQLLQRPPIAPLNEENIFKP